MRAQVAIHEVRVVRVLALTDARAHTRVYASAVDQGDVRAQVAIHELMDYESYNNEGSNQLSGNYTFK